MTGDNDLNVNLPEGNKGSGQVLLFATTSAVTENVNPDRRGRWTRRGSLRCYASGGYRWRRSGIIADYITPVWVTL